MPPTSSPPRHILICGTGALANLFAARLVASGAEITILGNWPEGLAALREFGVRLVQSDGTERTFAVRATNDPEACQGVRYALVLVKAWQTERTARQLTVCLASDGLALTLQNGLGNDQILTQHLGRERVALGVTTTGATLMGPGCVRPGGEGVISLGEHPGLGPLKVLLKQAGFKVETIDDVDALVWGKLVINAAINPLTALLRVPNGELVERASARLLMQDLAQETAAVAEAKGIRLPFYDPVAAAEDVARRTASNRSSMLQDVTRGAPTEIDAICGAIVREGERQGVPTAVNRALWLLVKAAIQERVNSICAP
ncbi:MAG: 2-dehydropantoate 2-reductase [Chloroflexota bacterium]